MMEKQKYFIQNQQIYRDVLSSISGKYWNTRYIVAKLTVISDEKVTVWKSEK